MYSDFILIDDDGITSDASRVERLALGDTSGRNEAWLRDTLLQHPGLLPIREIDPPYGPLIPLCREMRTDAGPVDAVYINPQGRLTLVECKLWRSPEARRKVVAQILDYARVVSRWTYSDLQRSVAAATGREGNVPFELARATEPNLQERHFVDQASAALRDGRFLLIIAGDGIRADVEAMAELITRNAAMGFSFGLVEVALYGMPDAQLLVQARTVARTQIVERTVVAVRDGSERSIVDEEADNSCLPPIEGQASREAAGNELGESSRQAAYRQWWQPVIDAPLDDPDQEPGKLFWPNNVRFSLPWENTWVGSYVYGGASGRIGVGTGGRSGADGELWRVLEPQLPAILSELPAGTSYRPTASGAMSLSCIRPSSDFVDDDARRAWLSETVNAFVNALRPRIKQLRAA